MWEYFYGNTSSTGILWMGSYTEGTTTCTSTAASDCYMWAVEDQILQQMHQMNQMQAAIQMQTDAQQQMRVSLENQRMQHELMLQERQLRQEAEQQRRQPARDRAKELLLANLTPAQKETFEKNNWFVVTGSRSKREYRIRANGVAMNIDVMDKEKVMHRLCAHLHHTHDAPLHDHILAQKLMLEAAEDDFLKVANRHAA